LMVAFRPAISGVYRVRLGATPAVVDAGVVDVGDGVVGDGGLDVGATVMTVVLGDSAFDVTAGTVVAVGVVAFFPPHPDITTASATTAVTVRFTDTLLNAIIRIPSVAGVASHKTSLSSIHSRPAMKAFPDSQIIRRLVDSTQDMASKTTQLHVFFNNCLDFKPVINARIMRLLLDRGKKGNR
jgi:hypothetical protein